jgi:major membrane immunogen (membrane-anchored lipoprotein)
MKRFVKKAGALLLVAAMAVGITACKSSDKKAESSQSGKVTLTYWNIFTGEPQKSMAANIIKNGTMTIQISKFKHPQPKTTHIKLKSRQQSQPMKHLISFIHGHRVSCSLSLRQINFLPLTII